MNDDNILDRLNHYYTNIILFIFVVVIGTPELVGNHIECWCPVHFENDDEDEYIRDDKNTYNLVNYVNYLCWISNTYYIPMSKPIPVNYEMRYKNTIYYYQWTPLIFLVMAALFKIPRAVWKYISNRSGFGIKKFLTTAKDTHNDEMLYGIRRTHQVNLFNAGDPPMDGTEFFPPGIEIETERQKTLSFLARYMHEWCKNSRIERTGLFCKSRQHTQELFDFGVGRRHGNFLLFLLIIVRFMYFINAVFQLVLLNEFLTDKFYIYGYKVISDILAGRDWSWNHARFPRVTLCDFDLRQKSNVQRYTLQCVLPINLYNEKVFVFLWFWLTFIVVISFLNLVFTLITACYNSPRENFILKYLKLNEIPLESNPKVSNAVKEFIYGHLKSDGIFLLQLLSNNAGSAVTMDVVRHLWSNFYEDYRKDVHTRRQSFASSQSLLLSRSLAHNSGLTQRNSNGNFHHAPEVSGEPFQNQRSRFLHTEVRNSFISTGSGGSFV